MDARSKPNFSFIACSFRRERLRVFHRTLHGPSEPRRMAYLSFCSPARLLRHISRHRERTITIPIMATPSFMPNQMESNVSTVHHLSQRVARHFVPDARSPVAHLNHEGRFRKKRWYLTLSVNGCSAATAESADTRAFPPILQARRPQFPRWKPLHRGLFPESIVAWCEHAIAP